jgi:hypothetical protein
MIFCSTYKKTMGASVPLKDSLLMIRESAGWSIKVMLFILLVRKKKRKFYIL